jgi:hypothetical protein
MTKMHSLFWSILNGNYNKTQNSSKKIKIKKFLSSLESNQKEWTPSMSYSAVNVLSINSVAEHVQKWRLEKVIIYLHIFICGKKSIPTLVCENLDMKSLSLFPYHFFWFSFSLLPVFLAITLIFSFSNLTPSNLSRKDIN